MNTTIASVLLFALLCTLVISPFSALALLMLFIFASGLIGLVSTLTQSVMGHQPTLTKTEDDRA